MEHERGLLPVDGREDGEHNICFVEIFTAQTKVVDEAAGGSLDGVYQPA